MAIPCSWFPPADEVYEDTGQEIFLCGFALGDEEGHRDESDIGDALSPVRAVQCLVLFQEPQKEGCADPFVAIHKRVVLDQEVQQICGLFFDTGIYSLPSKVCMTAPHHKRLREEA
ncbi:MAG: hypothetical protein ACXU9J_07375 [Syntrophales bacterium]